MWVERARRWVEWERERIEVDSLGRWYAAKVLQKSNTAKGGSARNAFIYECKLERCSQDIMNACTCCWVSVNSASLRSVPSGNGSCNRAFFARSWASEMLSRRNSSELYTFPLVLFVIVNEDILRCACCCSEGTCLLVYKDYRADTGNAHSVTTFSLQYVTVL